LMTSADACNDIELHYWMTRRELIKSLMARYSVQVDMSDGQSRESEHGSESSRQDDRTQSQGTSHRISYRDAAGQMRYSDETNSSAKWGASRSRQSSFFAHMQSDFTESANGGSSRTTETTNHGTSDVQTTYTGHTDYKGKRDSFYKRQSDLFSWTLYAGAAIPGLGTTITGRSAVATMTGENHMTFTGDGYTNNHGITDGTTHRNGQRNRLSSSYAHSVAHGESHGQSGSEMSGGGSSFRDASMRGAGRGTQQANADGRGQSSTQRSSQMDGEGEAHRESKAAGSGTKVTVNLHQRFLALERLLNQATSKIEQILRLRAANVGGYMVKSGPAICLPRAARYTMGQGLRCTCNAARPSVSQPTGTPCAICGGLR